MGKDKIFLGSWIKLILLICCTYLSEADSSCDQDLCADCVGATAFQCKTCKTTPSRTIILNNVCLPNCPYGFPASPSCTLNPNAVVDATFDQSTFSGSYGPFITGTSSSTYHFFWSPETVDPIPSYQQGLYFSEGKYLSTSSSFYPNYNVAFCLWYKPVSSSNDLLYIKPGSGSEILRVNSQGGLRLVLEQNSGIQGSTVNTGNNPNTSNNLWFFLSYTVTYTSSNGDTTMVQYLNTAIDHTTTADDQLLRWYMAGTQTLIIGKSPNGNFNGWVYNFKFWNTNYSGWAEEYSTVCGSGTNSCFVNCAFNKFWDGSNCQNCPIQCTNGCISNKHCNCHDSLCGVCTGWGSGLCSSCLEHASGGGAIPCSCNLGYFNSDGFTCTSCPTGCATCNGTNYYECSSCLSVYYFLASMCLGSCPSGYIQDPINHFCILSTNNPISLTLQNKIILDNISGFTVGESNTNLYPIWDLSDPVPSIGRGYHFSSGSYMTYPTLTISSYFTVNIWIMPSGSGNVATKFSSSAYFLLSFTSEGYPSLQLKLQDTSTITLIYPAYYFNQWHNIAFTGSISSTGNTIISLYADGLFQSSKTSDNKSPFIDEGTLYIGNQASLNGFTGFLWSLKAYNADSFYYAEWKTDGCVGGCHMCPTELLCPDTCSFGSFRYDGNCTECSSACASHGCRSQDTCTLCKYKECLACTSFDGVCTKCIENASLSEGICSCNSNAFWDSSSRSCLLCDYLCSACTSRIACNTCKGSAVLIGGMCLNACPYGFTANPCTAVSSEVIDIGFDTNFQGAYGIFNTSSSSLTFQFWDNPDSYDPIPAYKRGLYFSDGKHLVTSNSIYLSHTFSMGLWIYVITSGDILQKQNSFLFNSSGSLTATLDNFTMSAVTALTLPLSEFSGWTYLSFTILFAEGVTTITVYKNGATGQKANPGNYLYREPSSDLLYIGKSASNSTFSGFIYQFSLWNIAITDFSTKLLIPCGTSLDTSCLWSCPISHYYNESSCVLCPSTCTHIGCRTENSCNLCDDPFCSKCSGFGPNLCTLCVAHASKGPTTPCSCDINYILFPFNMAYLCILACSDIIGCAGCSGSRYYQCSSCLENYFYLNGLCLSYCPTGYSQDFINHQCILSSVTALSLSLQSLIKLNTVSGFTVGSSSSNNYPLWTDSADPIPCINRGYYFTTKSSMSLDSLIISPFYTISIWAKPVTQGNLFLKLNGSAEVFKISFTASLGPKITLVLKDLSEISTELSNSYQNSWYNYAYRGSVYYGLYRTWLNINKQLKSNHISKSMSPFIDSGSLYIGYSNGADSFVGFLWGIKVFNGNTHYNDEWIETGCSWSSEVICPDDCAFGTFNSSGICVACPNSCSTHGCRSLETCRLCKAKECVSCSSFDGDCTACIPNANLINGTCSCNSNAFWVQSSESCEVCDDLCTTCSSTISFECTNCTSNKALAGNICLHENPYKPTASSSIIDQNFDTYFQGTYGILQTSNSASTYHFFSNPESTDPIPSYSRGLYFSGNQHLQSNTKIYLNYKFSIGIWIYPIVDGDIIEKSPRLKLNSNGAAEIILENTTQAISIVNTLPITFRGWSYLSIEISYLLGSTTITTYLDAIPKASIMSKNLLFRDASCETLYIGKSSSSGFNGFIYYFTLWDIDNVDLAARLSDPCGSSLSTSCLWSCDIGHYFDGITYQPCDSCDLGCRRPGTCNICQDPLCSVCIGFEEGSCIQCVIHAWGMPCSCDDNYMKAADGFSCISKCYTGCASCVSELWCQCSSCLAGYYLLGQVCTPSCPTGYTQDSVNNQCILISEMPFNLQLQNLIQLGTVNGVQVGSSSSNIYPTFDNADPIPSLNRGYYFTPSSYMASSSLIMSTFFTVSIWVKPISLGNLMLKVNGNTEIFKISFSNDGMFLLFLTLQDTSTISINGSQNLFNAWHYLAITSDTSDGRMVFYLYTDYSIIFINNHPNNNPFFDSGDLKIGASNGSNGFTGFLWSLKVFNSNSHPLDDWKTQGCVGECSSCPYDLICPDNCDFGSYYSNGCAACSPICSSYGCRSLETCRLCLQKECLECDSFDGSCTTCIPRATLVNGECTCDPNFPWNQWSQSCGHCDSLCTQCSGDTDYYLCSACLPGKVSVGNICLHECPYGFGPGCSSVTDKVINQRFSGNFSGSYGIFTTATSSSSYQFWNSPEDSDPIPAKNRGLYFSNGKYLKSDIGIYFSHSFTIGFWYYHEQEGDIFEKENILTIWSGGKAEIAFENFGYVTTTNLIDNISTWTYLSFTVFYAWWFTSATIYYNNVVGTPSIINNYIYREPSAKLIILGKSSSSSFRGFIYNFNLWNSLINDFYYEIWDDVCGLGLRTSCLWNCNFAYYLINPSECYHCDGCPLGCTREISCNICDDSLCSKCSGFEPGLCESCISHASGSPCACDLGYYLSPNGFSCEASCPAGYLPDTNSLCIASAIDNCIIVENNNGQNCNKCANGYFLSENSDSCQVCDARCSTCLGTSTNCLTCKDPVHMSGSLLPGLCKCDDTYYWDISKSFTSCQPCGSSCAYCESFDNCLSCKDPAKMIISSWPGACKCIDEYYWNPAISDTDCQACDPKCKTCENSSGNCLSCKDLANMNESILPGPCQCNSGFYWNPSVSTTNCQACDSKCKYCATSSENCIICPDLINMGFSAFSGACKCNPGFYWDSEVSTTSCQVCNPKCYSCENSSTNCLVCKDTEYMDIEFDCECLPNMFFDGISCMLCDVNCATCSGSSTNCLTCKNQYYLLSNGNSNICVSCEDDSQGPPSDVLCGSQTEKLCSNSKIGFNIEFDNGTIIINFASNLKKTLQKKNFIIKLSNGTNYNTENCTLQMKSLFSYEIHTNLTDCDLPIFVELKFAALG
ncbi:unnamed protein product [Blepharisma stoltei]|uniref:EGF-like domain-containing protein n=1 Tax=Blepharisma stoltei TaxID=1481888 RepID=A0AAU9JZU3_9CILI|nr:unnamed protein product [Blepharisma stoltei]